jgi:hypothetical protein
MMVGIFRSGSVELSVLIDLKCGGDTAFPDPYPGEAFYSVYARFFERLGLNGTRELLGGGRWPRILAARNVKRPFHDSIGDAAR